MNFRIDNDNGVLGVEDRGVHTEMPLYSREAFETLSQEWVRVGWGLRYYFTFTWAGQPILQLPEDLIRLQEVVFTLQPATIIETGVFGGGSLLFHATLCEMAGKGNVIGIDNNIPAATREAVNAQRVAHRITMIEGDSTAASTIERVKALTGASHPVMVILDSHHSTEHVARELEAYAPLVTPGSCILVADGVMRDLIGAPGAEPAWVRDNPATAAHDFVRAHPEFEMRQPEWRMSLSPLGKNITYWPDGWLWRKP